MSIRTIIVSVAIFCGVNGFSQQKIFVSSKGKESGSGSFENPVKTIQKALGIAAKSNSPKIAILLRSGIYYPEQTIKIFAADFFKKFVEISAYQNEYVTISGAMKIPVSWKKYKDGIYQSYADIPFETDAMFIGNQKAILARYPNYDKNARVYNGTAADAISEERVKKWADPTGGFVHALHSGEWGSFDYRITGKDGEGKLKLEGGWQNNRPSPMHKEFRFVENVFEELDAPDEWYYNYKTKTIYFYPSNKAQLNNPTIAVTKLSTIFDIKGSSEIPFQNFSIHNLHFDQTLRTIMAPHEPLLRSDWMISRIGAINFSYVKKSSISNCEFYDLGGTAIMLSGYNKNISIRDNYIHHIGGSGICFVGDISAVRSPAFNYGQFIPYDSIDKIKGPKNDLFPADCKAENNLINNIGQIEKQATGVEISMSQNITVSHNTIYNTPRAGINIGDGCWGGHLIEFNRVFYTVLETGDHGAFNSWGRDRYWNPNSDYMDSVAAVHPEIILLDAEKTNIIRNNIFRCDHGWDIDLDDGSGNYHIYNNVCLNGGLKLREGFYRTVENNIILNNSFHPHVWFKNSGDIFRRNIVTRNYYPIQIKDWGKEVDYNLFPDSASLLAAQKNGTDLHSRVGNPLFVNAAAENYQVKENSPALKLGFVNFNTREIGTTNIILKSKAAKIPLPILIMPTSKADNVEQSINWLDASIRNVNGLGDRSAFGLDDENGVIVEATKKNISGTPSGLQPKDVIIGTGDKKLNNIFDLMNEYQKISWKGKMNLTIKRNQKIENIQIRLK